MRRAKLVVRHAIGVGRHRLFFLFGLAAVIFVPLGLLEAVQSEIGEVDTELMSDREVLEGLGVAGINVSTALLGEVLYAGAVSIAVISTPLGESPSLRRIMGEIRWGALIAIDLLFALGVLLGLLLLVVPGVIFFARYALTAVLAEVEERGVRDAFRRSAELSRGSYRLILGLVLGATALSEVATGLLGMLLDGLQTDHFLAEWAVASGGDILLNPISALLAVALALVLGARPTHAAAGST